MEKAGCRTITFYRAGLGRGAGVGRGLGVGVDLPPGVDVGVAVGVAVGVGDPVGSGYGARPPKTPPEAPVTKGPGVATPVFGSSVSTRKLGVSSPAYRMPPSKRIAPIWGPPMSPTKVAAPVVVLSV
jgi:hypothetical protein